MQHSAAIKKELKQLYNDQRSFAYQTLETIKGSKAHTEACQMLERISAKINKRNDFIYNMNHGRN